MWLGITATAQAQSAERRISLEGRAGLNVPTFDISDAVGAEPSFGLGAAVQFAPKLWLMETWTWVSTQVRNWSEVERRPT